MTTPRPVPAVSFQTARSGASTNANELGMRPMQERAYKMRGSVTGRSRPIAIRPMSVSW